MNNADVAAALNEIAELLELKNESSFRIRAYQKAAGALDGLTGDVRTLSSSGELEKVKGIGKGIAGRIDEMVATGTIGYLEELRANFPPGVRSLMGIPGIGPVLARRVFQELGVDSTETLREAVEDGRLASLPGLGQKSAANVLAALGRVKKKEARVPLGKALPLVEELISQLSLHAHNITAAGSLRRRQPTIGDIDLMATSSSPDEVMEAFVTLPQVSRVLGRGHTKSSILSDNGLQVDLRIVDAESFGALLQHFTGSKDHNIELRESALRQGLSLNEYGITSVETGDLRTFGDEESFYGALGLEWIPPEIRQGAGEIQAAHDGTLPNLVTLENIRGDLHCHTDWSDGKASMEEMVAAARKRGNSYVAITDHSSTIGFTKGLDSERLLKQVAAIRELDQEVSGIRVLAGTEVDIKRDGTLDFPNEVLAQLDWVVASIHTGFNQSREEITARILGAIENPHVDAIAHPTGRLIGRREPYEVDLEAVFAAAARTRTALEINSFPERLDLGDTQAKRARELGVMLVVDTDSHAPVHFENLRYGVAMARRAWAEPRDILNTKDYGELCAYLKSVEA